MLPHPARAVNIKKRKVFNKGVVPWLPLTLTLSPQGGERGKITA